MRLALAAALLVAQVAASAPPRIYVVDALHAPGPGTGLWRPTLAEALAARASLRRYLIAPPTGALDRWQLAGARQVAAAFDGYVMQAEGVRAPTSRESYGTEGAGPRQIHLDGFCDSIAPSFGDRVRREMQIVFDGGSCVFAAMYDMRTKRITRFRVNGVG